MAKENVSVVINCIETCSIAGDCPATVLPAQQQMSNPETKKIAAILPGLSCIALKSKRYDTIIKRQLTIKNRASD